MKALKLYAGPSALAHIRTHGLQAAHIGALAGAAGGPKGLILGPLDRFVFGDWLARSTQPVDLVAASIGAWRFACACMASPAEAFARFEVAYIHQHLAPEPGRQRPSAQLLSREFAKSLALFYDGAVDEIVQHPRYRLHVVTSRGRHVLRREHPLWTPLGYAGAYASNAIQRRWLGAWLERVVFSSSGDVPFATDDLRTLRLPLQAHNLLPVIQASCAIPFMFKAVHDIPGAPPGAHWDGGITDYHLHLHYRLPADRPIVLYPHFQKAVVPGWLDKALKWRHAATPALDNVLLLAPNPEWVRGLPNAKIPDRSDFIRYAQDLPGRIQAWTTAARSAQQLADEFATWLRDPDPEVVQPL